MRVGIVGVMDEAVSEVDVQLVLTELLGERHNVTVLSGGTKGVDTVARDWADHEMHDFILFKPQFMLDPNREKDVKDFIIRDKQIVDNSDVVVIIGPKDDKRCNRVEKHAKRRGKHIERRYL